MALGTGSISLTDVNTELSTSGQSLDACFSNALPYQFNATYEGSKDRLSNFRGYDASITPTFSISPTSTTEGNTAHSFDITVTSNDNWDVGTNAPSWIFLSTSSGSGNGTVTVTLTANAGSTRAGEVTFSPTRATGGFCDVTQDGSI